MPTPSPRLGSVEVPILMYHYIRNYPNPQQDPLGYNLTVSRDDFTKQMDWLQQQGYNTITFDDLAAYFNGTETLPTKPIILTFDDGYEDFYRNAVPILLSHHFRAVSYVVSYFLGRRNYMTADQVVAIDGLGMEVGAHSRTHPDLTTLQPDALKRQVAGSKSDLEALVHHQVLDFCYPVGRFNPVVIAAVQAAGFRDATTTEYGRAHAWDDRYVWTRVRVSGGETLQQFASALGA
jgi:peptidoglycan/xylan/chitin deacetylase (PgdA/CDA1 family)